jgi:hypothetical protein
MFEATTNPERVSALFAASVERKLTRIQLAPAPPNSDENTSPTSLLLNINAINHEKLKLLYE